MSKTAVRLIRAVVVILGAHAAAYAQSALDGFDPGINGGVEAIALQADNRILIGGAFTMLGGGGGGHTVRQHIGRLHSDGTLDVAFDPGANGNVHAIAVQADSKIVVVGDFFMVGGGGSGSTFRQFIGRLNVDGSVDPNFDPGANAAPSLLVVQPDGKILVAGGFTSIGGGGGGNTARNFLARLNTDGSVDSGFDPGANAAVRALALQPDGKILVGGDFTMIGGGGTGSTPRSRLARLNPNGSVDPNFDPGAQPGGLGIGVTSFLVQPDAQIVVGGNFTMIGGGGTGHTPRHLIARLTPDGTVDPGFDPGAELPAAPDHYIRTMALQPDGRIIVETVHFYEGYLSWFDPDGSHVATSIDFAPLNVMFLQPDRKLLIGYSGGVARLNPDRSRDKTLSSTYPNNIVRALAAQPDWKVLFGGSFSFLNDQAFLCTGARSGIARLKPDGSVDCAFNPGANGRVLAIAVQTDGRILVGGAFTMLGGGGTGTTPRSRLGRLNANGSIDAGFDPGADNTIVAIAMQTDGKILVGGDFTTIGGGGTGTTARSHLARLNPDGSLDTGFNPGANGMVNALAIQPNGGILVGGTFTTLGGGGTGQNVRNRIGRLNADGSIDAGFDPGADDQVSVVALQPDGKILVGGRFTTLGGGGTGTTARNRIARLNSDGSLDVFDPGANDAVYSLALQSDGSILASGDFSTLGGGATASTTTRHHIGRIAADGSVDGFDPGANGPVYALAIQGDGKIVVGGFFSALGGGGTGNQPRNLIGRLTNSTMVRDSLSATAHGGAITWLRSGPGPEITQVTFESSTDGIDYTPLPAPSRVAAGWQLTGQHLGLQQFIRARGLYATGQYDGSNSRTEFVFSVYIPALTPFTDDPLVPRTTLVKAVHVTELRSRIDGVRQRYGLSSYVYSDPTFSVGVTTVHAQHVLDLRAALAEAYMAAGLSQPTYSTGLTPGAAIRAADITEVRAALVAIE